MAMKNGVNWGNGFAIGDVDTKKCPLNCHVSKTKEESVTFNTFKFYHRAFWQIGRKDHKYLICLRCSVFNGISLESNP